MAAADRCKLDNLKVLLRRGANVNVLDGDGLTALHIAAERGASNDIIKALIDAGADTTGGSSGMPPAKYARIKQNTSTAEFIEQYSAMVQSKNQPIG
jgi:hypothetical protein